MDFVHPQYVPLSRRYKLRSEVVALGLVCSTRHGLKGSSRTAIRSQTGGVKVSPP